MGRQQEGRSADEAWRVARVRRGMGMSRGQAGQSGCRPSRSCDLRFDGFSGCSMLSVAFAPTLSKRVSSKSRRDGMY